MNKMHYPWKKTHNYLEKSLKNMKLEKKNLHNSTEKNILHMMSSGPVWLLFAATPRYRENKPNFNSRKWMNSLLMCTLIVIVEKTPHMLKRQAATLPIYSDCEPSLVQLTHFNFLFKSYQHFFKLGFNIGHTSNPTISFSLGLVSSRTFVITVNIRQRYRVTI